MKEVKESGENLTRVVGAVIFNQKRDAILVGQRAAGKRFPLKWEFIGGKVDEAENPNDAVVREFREEVGLDVLPIKLIDNVEFDYGGDVGKVRVYFIECKPVSGVILNFDQTVYKDIKWVNISDIEMLDWIEADKVFVAKFVSNYKNAGRIKRI